jgi:hypothetical protein
MAPKVPGRNHPVTPIIPLPAEDEHPFGIPHKDLPGKTPARTLHQLELRDAERHRIGIHSTHPFCGDEPRFEKAFSRVGLHGRTIHL